MHSCTEQDDIISPESIKEPRKVHGGHSPEVLFSYNVSDGIDKSESILIDNEGRVLKLSGESVRVAQANYIPEMVLSKWKNSAEPIEGIKINIEELAKQFDKLEDAENLNYRKSLQAEDASYTTSIFGYYFLQDADTNSTSACSCNSGNSGNVQEVESHINSETTRTSFLLEQTSESRITQSNESTEEILAWFKFIVEDLIDFSQFTDPK